MQDEINQQLMPERLRGEWAFALCLAALFLFYAGFTTFHHEMWRDEMEAWLVSRDSPSIFAVFQNFRYEGHPALWYLCLWPLARLTSNPAAMQWLNLLIATGVVLVIGKAAPAPRWVRALAVFGYFPVYEYGSIARNYAISLLLVVGFCAIFQRRRERPLLLGVLICFAANTSLPACLLAIAALFALLVDAIILPPEPSHRTATLAALGIAAGGIVLSALQMHPPVDSAYAPGWFFQFDPNILKNVLNALTKAYIPLLKPGAGFWNSDLLEFLPRYARWAWIGISATSLLVLGSLALVHRPVALVYYLFGSLGLLAFFYVKFLGYSRHHGFLFVCLATALWLARTMQPVTLPGLLDAAGRRAEQLIAVVFPLLLAIHVTAGGIAAASEYSHVFSAAKATASLIRERDLDRFMLIGARDYTAQTVVGYLEINRAYYSDGGRFGTYVAFNKAREVTHDIWDDAKRLKKQEPSPVVVLIDNDVLGKTPPPSELVPALKLVGCLRGEIVREESYCVFLLGSDPALP